MCLTNEEHPSISNVIYQIVPNCRYYHDLAFLFSTRIHGKIRHN